MNPYAELSKELFDCDYDQLEPKNKLFIDKIVKDTTYVTN